MIDADLQNMITILLTLIMAFIAWWQKNQKDQVVQVFTNPDIVPLPVVEKVLSVVPEESWKMKDDTLKLMLMGESAVDQMIIKDSVKKAEDLKRLHYFVCTSTIDYEIMYGAIINEVGHG
jgi:hypothetical protein